MNSLEVFDKTRFAFAPIVANRDNERDSSSLVVTAAFAIRDILPLITKANITIPIKHISSPLVSVDGNTSITDALCYMIRTGIRNIGINDYASRGKSKLLRTINDRKVLELIFSHKGREILRENGTAGLGDINIINHLDIISMARLKSSTTVSKAAELLMDIRTPCLISEGNEGEKETDNYIVTPWDVVMKTLKSENMRLVHSCC